MIEEVSYGAFEVKPREDPDPRPTWDLRPFLDIRDWSDAYQQVRARGDFAPFGRIGVELVDQALRAELSHRCQERWQVERATAYIEAVLLRQIHPQAELGARLGSWRTTSGLSG